MTENEFWYGITPRAFFNAVEGFESLRKTDLEIARLQTLRFMQSWGAKETDPRKLWQYPWEKEIKTKKEFEAQRKRGNEIAKRWQTR